MEEKGKTQSNTKEMPSLHVMSHQADPSVAITRVSQKTKNEMENVRSIEHRDLIFSDDGGEYIAPLSLKKRNLNLKF